MRLKIARAAGGTAGESGAVWRCVNPDCPAQVRGRIEHWCARSDGYRGWRRDFGGATGQGRPGDDVADLYALKLGMIAGLERMGKSRKTTDGVEASKVETCGGCCMGWGFYTLARVLQKALGRCFSVLDDVFAASVDQLTACEDVGQVIANSIVQWHGDDRNRKLIERLRKAGLNFNRTPQALANGGSLSSKTFVLSGTLPSLKQEEAGMTVKPAAARSTAASRKAKPITWWPAKEPVPSSARKLGVKVIVPKPKNRRPSSSRLQLSRNAPKPKRPSSKQKLPENRRKRLSRYDWRSSRNSSRRKSLSWHRRKASSPKRRSMSLKGRQSWPKNG